MTVIIGDFADPLSYLASQRAEQIRSLGQPEIRWYAVDADRSRPMTGRTLDATILERTRRLSLPGEALPIPGLLVPNSHAATAAYAESITDHVPEAMRRALFDALWHHGRNIADPEVIRNIVFTVVHPNPPEHDLEWRVRANQPIVALGDDSDPIALTRRLGFIVSTGGGPLTRAGQERIDAWRRLWHQHGAPELPMLLTNVGERLAGQQALAWLARQLPHRGIGQPEEADPPGVTVSDRPVSIGA